VFAQAHRLTDGYHYEARGDVNFRVLPQLELDLLPTATYDDGEPRYVATEAPDYVFGVQQARSAGLTARAAYTFTPELSLQAYAQAFVSRVHYPSFFSYPMGGFRERIHIADLAPSPGPTTTPDGAQATLNVNVVLRWEYHPGSTLFLVYTRAQAPTLVPPPGGDTSLDVRPILHGSAAIDVIMAKLTYWWG
jgi:hypothetical protein